MKNPHPITTKLELNFISNKNQIFKRSMTTQENCWLEVYSNNNGYKIVEYKFDDKSPELKRNLNTSLIPANGGLISINSSEDLSKEELYLKLFQNLCTPKYIHFEESSNEPQSLFDYVLQI